MAEYWVSQEKHWCKYCGCWTQGDANSIRFHENGKRHKEAVREFLFEERRKKRDDETAAKEMARTMADIESTARAAHAADLAARRTGMTAVADGAGKEGEGQGQGAGEGEGEGEGEDDGGVYLIRGVQYLQADRHAAQLTAGKRIPVEFFDAAAQAWRGGVLVSARVLRVPNTTIVTTLSMVAPLEDGKPAPDAAAVEVAATNLRLRVEDAPLPHLIHPLADGDGGGGGGAAHLAAAASTAVEESTGLGVWQTVAAHEMDPALRPREPGAAPVADGDSSDEGAAGAGADAAAREQVGSKRKRGGAAAADASTNALFEAMASRFGDADAGVADAYGYFNPYGGKYRGFDLEAEEQREAGAGDAGGAGAPATKRSKGDSLSDAPLAAAALPAEEVPAVTPEAGSGFSSSFAVAAASARAHAQRASAASAGGGSGAAVAPALAGGPAGVGAAVVEFKKRAVPGGRAIRQRGARRDGDDDD